MTHFDHSLFLALNFDGGPCWDRVMLTLSGTAVWIPLYLLILWLVLRRTGWRGLLLFLVLMAAAVGLADITAGIFKHNGLLGDLLPGLEPRWRPMFTPSLEGLDIAPDSLRTLRRLTPEALRAAGEDFRLLLLSDHMTYMANGAHGADPVPFVLYDSRVTEGSGLPYSEANGAKGPYVDDGAQLMDLLFELKKL